MMSVLDQPPPSYEKPRVIFLKDHEGQMTSSRFFLSWDKQEHSMVFLMLWKDYHWESQGGGESIVLKLHDPQMDRLSDKVYARHLMFEPSHLSQSAFLRMYDTWMADVNSSSAVQGERAPQRLSLPER